MKSSSQKNKMRVAIVGNRCSGIEECHMLKWRPYRLVGPVVFIDTEGVETYLVSQEEQLRGLEFDRVYILPSHSLLKDREYRYMREVCHVKGAESVVCDV